MLPDQNDESPAQDPNATESQDEGTEGEGSTGKKNFVPQERVDEITAKYRDMERKVNALEERNLALMTAQLTGGRQAAPEPEVDEYPDMDPSVKSMLKKEAAKLEAKFQRQQAATQAQYESMIMSQEAAAHAAKMGASEEVQEEAKTWARDLRKNGVPINAKDAAIYALGLAVSEGRHNPGTVTQQPPARRGAAPIGSVRQPNLTPVDGSQKPLPSNFSSLSPDQQIAILEKRGTGDKPI